MKKIGKYVFEFFFGFRDIMPCYKETIIEVEKYSGVKVYEVYVEYRIFTRSIGFINCFEWGFLKLVCPNALHYLDTKGNSVQFNTLESAKSALKYALEERREKDTKEFLNKHKYEKEVC